MWDPTDAIKENLRQSCREALEYLRTLRASGEVIARVAAALADADAEAYADKHYPIHDQAADLRQLAMEEVRHE